MRVFDVEIADDGHGAGFYLSAPRRTVRGFAAPKGFVENTAARQTLKTAP
jgi:hypothetical protein